MIKDASGAIFVHLYASMCRILFYVVLLIIKFSGNHGTYKITCLKIFASSYTPTTTDVFPYILKIAYTNTQAQVWWQYFKKP